ncbi:MAG TPA: AAA family ATPase [Acidocella sp.]|nr:AAA family ATPase [Acidocella sp.]
MQDDLSFVSEDLEHDFDEIIAIEAPQTTETAPGFDSAKFLAALMLRQALGKPDTPAPGKRLPAGFYIVQAPSEDWATELQDAAVNVLRGGDPPPPTRRRQARDSAAALCLFLFSDATDLKQAQKMAADIQTELALGQVVVLITATLASLPLALQRASDRIITVPPPSRRQFAALVRAIVPKLRRLALRGLDCARLTPANLRLAYRPKISAAAFLRRLHTLTATLPHPTTHTIIPLARLHGVDDAKKWAAEVKADMALYHQGQLTWPQVQRGLLLCGVPGTAKTTLAGAIAAFCGMAYVPTSFAAWQRSSTGHLGEVLKAMAAAFAEARSRAPAVLFIDELDTLGSRKQSGQHSDWWRAIINALLEQIAGAQSNNGVIIIAATNHPDQLDPALLRSGRIEDRIVLHPPGAAALSCIYADQLEGELDSSVDLTGIGLMSAGLTGADVSKICTAARRRARTAQRPVTYEDLVAAITQDDRPPDPEQLRRVAIHEAGHAIAALASPDLRLGHVSIVPRGSMSGGAALGLANHSFMTPARLDAYLVAILSGRAAEEVLLGEISSGAGGGESSDLCRATQLAADAELSLGLRRQGLTWYAPQAAPQLGALFARRPDLEQAVRERLDHAYERACDMMRAKAPLVQALAQRLLRQRVMSGAEIAALAHDAAPPPPAAPPLQADWMQ